MKVHFSYGIILFQHVMRSVLAELSNTIALGPNEVAIMEDEFEIGYVQSLILEDTPLYSSKSVYQDIKMYQSKHYGKVFVLDDCLQLTERDAAHYNEMLAHVPIAEYMAKNADKINSSEAFLRVLVIGGGDGYVVSEVLKHTSVAYVDHVDLDEEVIKSSEKIFPWAADLWQNERVNLHIADGSKFVKEQLEKGISYHIIIQDASDPFYYDKDDQIVVLPSSVLYTREHFETMYKMIKAENGVMTMQGETYNIPSNLVEIKKWLGTLSDIGFQRSRYGSISIGTYPTGQIGFITSHAASDVEKDVCFSSQSCDDFQGIGEKDFQNIKQYFSKALVDKSTKYYHPRIHRSSFDLPLWVEAFIYPRDDDDELKTVDKYE